MDYQDVKKQVLYHDHMYYVLAAPIIKDSEYDYLYNRLIQLEKAQGYRDYDSPTVKVGATDHRQGKVKHPNRVYSLDKVYTENEVDPRFTVKTPKLDGACAVIHMNKGKIVAIISRGDGEVGENITPLFQDFNFVDKLNEGVTDPDYLDLISIPCEAVTLQKVDNYRNYVAGALNLKDKKEFDSREIFLVAHDVLGVDKNYSDRMSYIGNFMLTVLTSKEYLKQIPTDGVVYRTNSRELEKTLGYTSKHPKFAVALKQRETETAETILTDVIWSVGRTGMVNPTGIVEPVLIGGATVSRLTLHNLAFIEYNDICIGDRIKIERAGEIIPTYVETIAKSPVRQPITIQTAEESISNKVVRFGPRLFVADKSVNDEKAILYFVNQMGIQGLGPASIEKMGLTHISELYKPLPWESLGVNGKKIAQEIEYSKTKAYEYVLAGLGIPGVGHSLARKIIAVIPKFSDLHKIEFEKIDKIGPKITDKILTWLDDNADWVKQLPVQLEQKIDTSRPRRVVCITGKLDRTRKEIAALLETKGFDVKDSVSKGMYALITDGKITSDKTEKAAKYGIRVVNYFDQKDRVLDGTF